jgi:type IV secretion system protein VirB3
LSGLQQSLAHRRLSPGSDPCSASKRALPMTERNSGVTADPLFVGVTRPPMRFGVTYAALLVNVAFTMEVFILTKNLVVLLLVLPIHGVCMLLCARDARYFDLLLVWTKTRLLGYSSSIRFWKGASYSPLTLDLPDSAGVRKAPVTVHLE